MGYYCQAFPAISPLPFCSLALCDSLGYIYGHIQFGELMALSLKQGQEIIAELHNERRSKSYPVLEYHADKLTLDLLGEFDSVFTVSIRQAIRSGYQLKSVIDDRLKAEWKNLSESIDPKDKRAEPQAPTEHAPSMPAPPVQERALPPADHPGEPSTDVFDISDF